MNLREATAELGLTEYAIYAAVQRGQLRAFQRNGGRTYYSERELREILRKAYSAFSAAA